VWFARGLRPWSFYYLIFTIVEEFIIRIFKYRVVLRSIDCKPKVKVKV
jgi:hypothetical protein